MKKDNQKAPQEGKPQCAEDRALDRFTELVIEKMQHLQQDWKQPWFSETALSVPRNLSGRNYNGMNSLMLMLHCQKNNYQLPVFATFDRLAAMNYTKQKDGTRTPAVDADGQKLPMVAINKGERSFPVMITTFTCVDKDTREKIPYDEYKNLDQDAKAQYNVYPKMQVFNVFSVEQTNLKESRPELYAKFEEQCKGNVMPLNQKGQVMPAVEALIKDNGWYCPIKEVHGDAAYYSISRDEIVLPERHQFKDLESFQTNLFHECAHSSGSENRLGRLKSGSTFGSAEYAKEELTAELTAAFVSANYGMTKGLKTDSAPYLKSWLESLHEKPEFLKTVLMDVKRSSSMLIQRIDAINQRIEQSLPPVAEEWRQGHEPSHTAVEKGMEVAAKSPAQPLTAEEVKTKLDTFMQQYYFAARRDNGVRMAGFVEHEGKPAVRLVIDSSTGTSNYIVSHEQDEQRNDHFHMHLMDNGCEIFKSREMPHNRDDAYGFIRGAVREQADYEYEKRESAQEQSIEIEQEQEEKQSFRRGR